MKIFTFCFLLTVSASVFAAKEPERVLSRIAFNHYKLHQAETPDHVGLNYVELLDENDQEMSGPPILLMHGFTSNWNSFLYVADYYRARGFRVFVANWRGHGQGQTRSVILNKAFDGSDLRYGFENLPIYDVPTMIDAIYEKTGQKVIYQGHSMGGMMAHLAFAGLAFDHQGYVTVSSLRARDFEKKVAAFIPVGSPLDLAPDQKQKNDIVDLYLLTFGIQLDHSKRFSELSFSLTMVELINLRTTYEFARASRSYEGLINLKNMTFEEYVFMSRYGGSDVPHSLLESLKQFRDDGYKLGFVDLSSLSFRREGHLTKIPTLVVSGDLDSLAPIEQQKELAHDNQLPHVIFENTGHIDLTASKLVAEKMAAATVEYLKTLGIDPNPLHNCESLLK